MHLIVNGDDLIIWTESALDKKSRGIDVFHDFHFLTNFFNRFSANGVFYAFTEFYSSARKFRVFLSSNQFVRKKNFIAVIEQNEVSADVEAGDGQLRVW